MKAAVNSLKKASEAPVVDQPGWMRGAEAARYAAISRRTLSEWMRRRMIPFLKVSHRVTLFRRADLDRALLRFTVKSAGPEL